MATALSNAARVDLERRIVLGLIRSLSKSGFRPYRTYDGESWVTALDEAAAMKSVFAVDEISLRFAPSPLVEKLAEAVKLVANEGPGGLPSGAVKSARRRAREACDAAEHGVLLVLGNGEDVISDWNFTEGDPDGFSAAMGAFCYDSADGRTTMLARLPSGADLAAVIS